MARDSIQFDRTAAPDWFSRFILSLQQFMDGQESIKTKIVAATADLPDAATWRGRQVYITAINRVVISTGSGWVRTDTGAAP